MTFFFFGGGDFLILDPVEILNFLTCLYLVTTSYIWPEIMLLGYELG